MRFCFRLALSLGMPVGEMLARMSSAELTYWIAYASLEPFGPLAEEQRAGVVASTVYAMNAGKRAKPMGPSDFFPALRERLAALIRPRGNGAAPPPDPSEGTGNAAAMRAFLERVGKR